MFKLLNILQIQNNSVARGFQNNEVCFEIPLLLICFVFAKYLLFHPGNLGKPPNLQDSLLEESVLRYVLAIITDYDS